MLDINKLQLYLTEAERGGGNGLRFFELKPLRTKIEVGGAGQSNTHGGVGYLNLYAHQECITTKQAPPRHIKLGTHHTSPPQE